VLDTQLEFLGLFTMFRHPQWLSPLPCAVVLMAEASLPQRNKNAIKLLKPLNLTLIIVLFASMMK